MAAHVVLLIAAAGFSPPRGLWSRRGAVAAATASFGIAPATAFNLERFVAEIDRGAASRTSADFSSVIQVTPISGPVGVGSALVTVDAGNAGDFEYLWLKDAFSGKILAAASSKAPTMTIKAQIARGAFVIPLAYSKEVGLYEGDPFEVTVADYVPAPNVQYPGRPEGPITIGGDPLYKKGPPVPR